jgi:hypothetical protein
MLIIQALPQPPPKKKVRKGLPFLEFVLKFDFLKKKKSHTVDLKILCVGRELLSAARNTEGRQIVSSHI